jgi:hypothetical protein
VSIDRNISQNHLLRGIVVPIVGSVLLIMPDVLARVRFEGNDGAGKKIVATFRAAIFLTPRSSVASPDVEKVKLGVVDDGIPDRAATA